MSDPYLGEIRMFGGSFAPAGWAFCNGQTMAISENDALFNLIGTTYGGDGQQTFNLPDLQGRLPVHMGTSPNSGQSFTIGETAGVETVTLTVNQLPVHTHAFVATTDAGAATAPGGSILAKFAGNSAYLQGTPTSALAANSLLPDSGGSQPHENQHPFLCVSFIISLFGIFPTQT